MVGEVGALDPQLIQHVGEGHRLFRKHTEDPTANRMTEGGEDGGVSLLFLGQPYTPHTQSCRPLKDVFIKKL